MRSTVQGQQRQKVYKTPSQSIVGCISMHLSSQATQKAEIRGITVPGHQRRPHLNEKKLGMVTCACHLSCGKKHKIGRL
jgi:hypothetical protein